MIYYLYLFPDSLSRIENSSTDDVKEPIGLRYFEMLYALEELSGHKVVSENLFKHMSIHYVKDLISLGDYFSLASDNFGFLICCKDNYEIDKNFFGQALSSALEQIPEHYEEVKVITPLSNDAVDIIPRLTTELFRVHNETFNQRNISLFSLSGFQKSLSLKRFRSDGEVIH